MRDANAKMEFIACAILVPRKKRLIEWAYQLAEACGIPLWNQDEAGPYATRPQSGASWQREGHPNLQPHEYLRDGGAKRMTLLHPATGEVRAKGVISVTNAVFHQRARLKRFAGSGAAIRSYASSLEIDPLS